MLLLVYGVFVEPHLMKVRRVKISESQGIKVAHFTDTHFTWHTPSRRFEKFAKNMAEEQPDMIVFSGDLFDQVSWAENQENQAIEKLLTALSAPLGKFAVLGNHDFDEKKSSIFVEDLLTRAGFMLLKNHSVRLGNLSISGVDDWRKGQPDLEILPEVSDFSLLLIHEPDTILDLKTVEQFDLILSGHSHGGQIRLGNWRLHNNGSSSADSGLYQLNARTKLYVNCGIGLTFLPIRIGVKPEIVYYEL